MIRVPEAQAQTRGIFFMSHLLTQAAIMLESGKHPTTARSSVGDLLTTTTEPSLASAFQSAPLTWPPVVDHHHRRPQGSAQVQRNAFMPRPWTPAHQPSELPQHQITQPPRRMSNNPYAQYPAQGQPARQASTSGTSNMNAFPAPAPAPVQGMVGHFDPQQASHPDSPYFQWFEQLSTCLLV